MVVIHGCTLSKRYIDPLQWLKIRVGSFVWDEWCVGQYMVSPYNMQIRESATLWYFWVMCMTVHMVFILMYRADTGSFLRLSAMVSCMMWPWVYAICMNTRHPSYTETCQPTTCSWHQAWMARSLISESQKSSTSPLHRWHKGCPHRHLAPLATCPQKLS